MADDRKLKVTIVGDTRSLNRSLGQAETSLKRFNRVAGASGLAGASTSSALLRGGVIGAGLGIATREAFKFAEAASDLNEQVSKTKVVFGGSSQAILDWSKNLDKSFGLAQTQALAAASTFGSMFAQTGRSEEDATKLSKSVVELAADLASFNNTSVDDALNALRSGLSGEIEPLRRYQVFLTEASVQQQALADTGKTSAKQLTQGEKITARYELIMRSTTKAQGDFARTSGGLANQQRILAAEVANLETKLGQGLVPALTLVVESLNKGIAAATDFGTALANIKLPEAFGGGFLSDLSKLRGVSGLDLLKGLNRATGGGIGESITGIARDLGLGGGKPATTPQSPFGINFTNPAEAAAISAAGSWLGGLSMSGSGFVVNNRGRFAFGGGKASPVVTGLSIAMQTREVNARLTGNQDAIRAVLEDEAKALKEATTDLRLKPKQKLALKTALLGVTSEIKSMDEAAAAEAKARIADAKARRNAAKAAAETLARQNQENIAAVLARRIGVRELGVARAGLTPGLSDDIAKTKALIRELQIQVLIHTDDLDLQNRLVDAQKSLLSLEEQKLALAKEAVPARKDEADQIKSATLALLDQQHATQENNRAIRDAREALRQARIIGAPAGIMHAKETLADALFAQRRQRIEDRMFRVGPGVAGREQLRIGNVVININGAQSPEAIAKQVLAVLQKRSKHSVAQPRGRQVAKNMALG